MPILYTHECPKCGKKTRDWNASAKRCERCPKMPQDENGKHKDGPWLVLTDIDTSQAQ